ncbi:class I SAM-dependent methyltransferase [Alphaproteobacteria bacterium]|nr:class I SAM-dependent methyltransferase [Alphaproteobacteria bacterium]
MSSSNAVFNTYGKYYDLLYQDKDYDGETAYISAILNRHGVTVGDLLELGSGTGKHGCLLAKRGYTVFGIERSAEMVALAPKLSGFRCQQADICSFNLGRTYDAVISLFHVLSYQIKNDQLNAVFANAALHLNAGGLFVFDMWYSPAVCAQRPEVRVKRMTDDTVEITRIAEPKIYPNENRVDVSYTIYARNLATGVVDIMQETHPMRHFSLPEIETLADIHDFEMFGAEEFMSGKNPSEGTWGVCVVFKKKGSLND